MGSARDTENTLRTAHFRWFFVKKHFPANHLQPTVYLYTLRMIQPEEITFRWDVLVKNKTPLLVQYPADRTEEDFRRMVEIVKLMQAMIDAEHFIPNEGRHFCRAADIRMPAGNGTRSLPTKQLAAV